MLNPQHKNQTLMIVAVACWTACVILALVATVVAIRTAQPPPGQQASLTVVFVMWSLVFASGGSAATAGLLITKSQYELAEDVATVIDHHHPVDGDGANVRRMP
jgi:hypothetical protein